MKIRRLILFFVILCVAIGSAYSRGAEEVGDEIRIGAVYPLSGPVAPIGVNVRRGVDFAVDEINADGGINGRRLVIVYGDSTGVPATGMSEAERLAETENVIALLGAYQSAVTNVVSEVAQRQRIPMLTAISTADAITTRGFDYFYRLCPTNMMYLRDMIQYSYDVNEKYNLGYRTIGYLVDKSLLGQETLKWGKYWAEELGDFEIVEELQYEHDAVELSAEVIQMRRANPDVLVVDPYISDAILLTQTLHDQGFAPKIMIGKATGLIDPSFIPAVRDLANGISTTVEWNQDMPKGADVNERFRERFGMNMNGHSAESYTAVYVLAEALRSVGDNLTREAVRQALDSLVIEGNFWTGQEIILPYDRIEFREFENEAGMHTNQNPHARVTITQIRDGEYWTVWPFEVATAEPWVDLSEVWRN